MSNSDFFYATDKQSHKAIEKFTAALKGDDKNEAIYSLRGSAYLNLGKHAEAIQTTSKRSSSSRTIRSCRNNYAWVLCTSPNEKLRDGHRAIEMAKQAAEATDYKEAYILSTLAAAYAETGDFENASSGRARRSKLATRRTKKNCKRSSTATRTRSRGASCMMKTPRTRS